MPTVRDGADPVITLASGAWSPKAAQLRNAGVEELKAAFVDFARLVVVADDATLRALADKFVAGRSGVEWESGESPRVSVTQPITLSHVEKALDEARPVRRDNFTLGGFLREGGGFQVAYSAPFREMKGSVNGHPFTLQVAPDDLSRFNYREDTKGQPGTVKIEQMEEALRMFMEALGRPAPANVTFTQPFGD